MTKIDRAYTSPGLIARARAYKLFAESDGLYIIHIGPASNDISSTNAFKQGIYTAVQAKMELKLKKNEQAMANKSLQDLMQDKHSKFFPKGSISKVEVSENFKGRPTLFVKSSSGKFKFYFMDFKQEELEALARKLQAY